MELTEQPLLDKLRESRQDVNLLERLKDGTDKQSADEQSDRLKQKVIIQIT